MADVSKAQKLASARKKFKELKKEKKKNAVQKPGENVESAPTSREQTPVEGVINEVHNSTNEHIQYTQLPNYFSNVTHNNGYQPPEAFFDTFVQTNTSTDNFFEQKMVHSNPLTVNLFDNGQGEDTQKPQVNIEENKIDNPITVKEEVPSSSAVEENEVTPDNNIKEEVDSFKVFDTVKFDQEFSPQPAPISSVESLKQLSNQMAELINPTEDFQPSAIESQLEIRNQELAGLLQQERVKSEQLTATLYEYQARLTQLETELRDRDLHTDAKIQQELSSLREELQYHVQTVGILVSEKTELTASLSQFQLAAKQKTGECEELQGRLKASRSRVADLEREVTMLKNEKSQYDVVGKEHGAELDKLKKNHHSLKEEKDELMQDLLEVREKLKNSSESCLVFQQQVAELSNQLAMANIKIQQLTTGEQDHAEGRVEQLTQEKFALEKQIADLNHTVKTISKEREESSLQYQQYAQQLNGQINNLAAKLEQLQKENETLSIQEQNRIKHISELEKQLQNLQNDHVTFAVQRSTGDTKAELDAAIDLIEKLKGENAELQDEHIHVLNEKELLAKDLEAKAEALRELEGVVKELRSSQPNSAKLLAKMESDQVAAARAVTQNTEMKKQMDSMEEVFIKLNNDKVDLTEKLNLEQRSNRDLMEKLQKTELHLQTLADAIEIKDKELCHLRENSEELSKQVLQSEHLTDRLRHYEAQDHSSPSLQMELQEAKLTIAKLSEDINQLRRTQVVETNEVDTNGTESEEKEEIVQLRQKLNHLEVKNKELEEKLNSTIANVDSNHNDKFNMLDNEAAMKHLEQKFLRTMEDIANLTEEKHRLEHLVMQLQGETETIGEYVALYQHQRSMLRQRAIEKDQQLTQLANDREQIKGKLETLNDLVRKLVLEKGNVPPELLEHHDNINQGLCEEHAKINSEINRIAQNSFTIEPNHCDKTQSTETAEQIIELLSEIKSSNLVQPTENFHHCPWCSGKLITV